MSIVNMGPGPLGSDNPRLLYMDVGVPAVCYAKPRRPITMENVCINLDDKPDFYTKEEIIKGTVNLKLSKDDKIKSISVFLEGWCKTEGIAQHPESTPQDDWLAFVERHRLVYDELTVFPPSNVLQVKKSDTTFKVPKGKYQYPFKFKLPEFAECGVGSTGPHHQYPLPLTYHMKYISTEVDIEYRICVTVERTGFLSRDWLISEPIYYLPLGPTPSEARRLKRDIMTITSNKVTLTIPKHDQVSSEKPLPPEDLKYVEFYLGCLAPSKLVPGATPNFRLFLLSNKQLTGKISLQNLFLGLRSSFKFRAQSLGHGGIREIPHDVNFYSLKQSVQLDLTELQSAHQFEQLPFVSNGEVLEYTIEITNLLKNSVSAINVEPTFQTCAFGVSHRIKLSASFKTYNAGFPTLKRSETYSRAVEVTTRTMLDGWSTDDEIVHEQLPVYKRVMSPAPRFSSREPSPT